MSDSLLITPDVIEDGIVNVITRLHPQHLAKYERARGMDAETVERFRTVSHMASDSANGRLSGDVLPACLLGIIGTSSAPLTNAYDRLDVSLQLAMQVTVLGQRRRDTLRRRDVLAWTTIECLLQRLPRNGPVASVQLTDYEPVEERDDTRILADARMIFVVTVADMVTVVGGLPTDDTPWQSGGPNAGPATPYGPVADDLVASEVTYSIQKESIVE